VTVATRPLYGMVFAALLALSLVATASQALADTRGGTNGRLPNIFDPGVVEKVTKDLQRPIGRFGVSWE
jgi:hypothetical protein